MKRRRRDNTEKKKEEREEMSSAVRQILRTRRTQDLLREMKAIRYDLCFFFYNKELDINVVFFRGEQRVCTIVKIRRPVVAKIRGKVQQKICRIWNFLRLCLELLERI